MRGQILRILQYCLECAYFAQGHGCCRRVLPENFSLKILKNLNAEFVLNKIKHLTITRTKFIEVFAIFQVYHKQHKQQNFIAKNRSEDEWNVEGMPSKYAFPSGFS